MCLNKVKREALGMTVSWCLSRRSGVQGSLILDPWGGMMGSKPENSQSYPGHHKVQALKPAAASAPAATGANTRRTRDGAKLLTRAHTRASKNLL